MAKRKYLAELYRTDSKGKTRIWRIWVDDDRYYMEHGLEDGKLVSEYRAAYPKNVGRSNETTARKQALSEALALIEKKRDKGYSENRNAKTLVLPMLAHDFKKRGNNIKYPCYIQPKLDGIRCLATLDGYEVKLLSRMGKPFVQPLKDLRNELFDMFTLYNSKIIFDGELYTKELPFEQIVAAIKNHEYREIADLIEFHVFDIITNKSDFFEKRCSTLQTIFKEFNSYNSEPIIKSVDTILTNSAEEAFKLYAKFMELGYEGIMFRNMDSLYKYGPSRSADLLKYKEFQDQEFKIVDAKEGTGIDTGTVVWICELGNDNTGDNTFECRPRGTREQRKEWWDNKTQYFGKYLTVRYQNLTAKNVPRFPVGLIIRDYEE